MANLLNLGTMNGFNNRHILPLPKRKRRIQICFIDGTIDNAIWIPFNKKNYTIDTMPVEGYLGTAKSISNGIGYHAWKQNDSEFVFYKFLTIKH